MYWCKYQYAQTAKTEQILSPIQIHLELCNVFYIPQKRTSLSTLGMHGIQTLKQNFFFFLGLLVFSCIVSFLFFLLDL